VEFIFVHAISLNTIKHSAPSPVSHQNGICWLMLDVRLAYPVAVTLVTVNLQPLPLDIPRDVEVATPFVAVVADVV
jgi:hypothetical protein